MCILYGYLDHLGKRGPYVVMLKDAVTALSQEVPFSCSMCFGLSRDVGHGRTYR